MEGQIDDSYFFTSKEPGPFVFVIDFRDPKASEPTTSGGKCRRSIVVRIEREEALFTLSAMEPERATRIFAEVLAEQTAFLAMEKDFPNGFEPNLSAELIDQVPVEFENRLPDLCVNGNNAWLVDPRIGISEVLFAQGKMRPTYG